LNWSILFMLSVVFGLPVAFAFLIRRAYRSAAERASRGEELGTPGALRWSASDPGGAEIVAVEARRAP
jgi:hypothetical protein